MPIDRACFNTWSTAKLPTCVLSHSSYGNMLVAGGWTGGVHNSIWGIRDLAVHSHWQPGCSRGGAHAVQCCRFPGLRCHGSPPAPTITQCCHWRRLGSALYVSIVCYNAKHLLLEIPAGGTTTQCVLAQTVMSSVVLLCRRAALRHSAETSNGLSRLR